MTLCDFCLRSAREDIKLKITIGKENVIKLSICQDCKSKMYLISYEFIIDSLRTIFNIDRKDPKDEISLYWRAK